jgi:predicted dehydrogenase
VGDQGTAVINYFESPEVPQLAYRTAEDAAWKAVDCSQMEDRFVAEIRHFLSCVRKENRQPSVTVEDGLRASAVVSQAYRSANTDGRRLAIV